MGEVLFWPIQLARLSFNQVSRVRFLAGLQGIENSFGSKMVECFVLITSKVSGEGDFRSVTVFC